MKADSKSMSYLSTVKQFEIPYFQRAYVWEEDNWEQLVEQWKYGKDVSHFLGSIIVNNPYTSTDNNYHNVEVIDGQQRLTTLTIMYKAIYDVLMNNAVNDIEKGKYISEKDKILGEDNLRIIHSEFDNKYYTDIMENRVKVGEIYLSSELKSEQRGKNKKISECPKIYQCYRYFYKYFTYNTDKIVKMWEDLNSSTKMIFVVIDIDANDDPQQIFDCTNSAGVRLTVADLVKNDLFRKLNKFYDKNQLKNLYDDTWKKTFELDEQQKTFWESDKTLGRSTRNNIELLLYCVLEIIGAYVVPKNKVTELYTVFKEYINACNKDSLIDFLNKTISFAKIYFNTFNNNWKLQNVSFNNKIELIDFITFATKSTTFYPYIIKTIYEDNDIERNFSILLKLMLRVAICQDAITLKDYTYANYSLVNGSGQTIENYYNERMKKGSISDADVMKGLQNLENRNQLANIILFLLELKLRNNDKFYNINSRDLKYCYSLEHIMPQKYELFWNFNIVPVRVYKESVSKWVNAIEMDDFNKDIKRREAIYSIGNMILLSKNVNSKISNRLLGDKNDEKSKMFNIKKYGSDLIVNKDFIEMYDTRNKWDEEEIYNRTYKLTHLIITELLDGDDKVDSNNNIYKSFNYQQINDELYINKFVERDEIVDNLYIQNRDIGNQNYVNWNDPTFKDYEKSKPIQMKLGDKIIKVNGWKAVLNEVFKYLYFDKGYKNKLLDNYLDVLPERGMRELLVSKIASDSKEQKKYIFIENGVYLYNHYNTSFLLSKINMIFTLLHFDKNLVKIYYEQ